MLSLELIRAEEIVIEAEIANGHCNAKYRLLAYAQVMLIIINAQNVSL